MYKRSKFNQELIEKGKVYSPEEAITIIQSFQKPKFDESVEVHFKLGINPAKTEQQVRGSADLPNGTGKEIKIAVFSDDPLKIKEAKEAGALITGGESLIEEIRSGKATVTFDVAVATPDMMIKLAKIAKILGPRGLMPNPKNETVTLKVAEAIEKLKKGKVSFKNDKGGNIHMAIGKVSFTKEQLVENYESAKKAIERTKPEGVKGKFIRSIFLSSTMGKGLKIL